MATNDTISDMLTRIRNATLAKHQTTSILVAGMEVVWCFANVALRMRVSMSEMVSLVAILIS